jgi:hypothetical protein
MATLAVDDLLLSESSVRRHPDQTCQVRANMNRGTPQEALWNTRDSVSGVT